MGNAKEDYRVGIWLNSSLEYGKCLENSSNVFDEVMHLGKFDVLNVSHSKAVIKDD